MIRIIFKRVTNKIFQSIIVEIKQIQEYIIKSSKCIFFSLKTCIKYVKNVLQSKVWILSVIQKFYILNKIFDVLLNCRINKL